MKSNAFYAVIGVGVVLILIVAWFGFSKRTPTPVVTAPEPIATSTAIVTTTGSSIYASGQYGFTVSYPASATLEDPFKAYYHLPSYWRVNALPEATGTPVIAVVGYRVVNDATYPRYFDTEVRVGVSADPKELKSCLVARPNSGESALPDVKLGDTTFKVFAFQDAAMMQYSKGVSYRAIHTGKCYAVEQVQTGSSYRDDPKSAKDIPDADLQQHYTDLEQVIQSFRFAN